MDDKCLCWEEILWLQCLKEKLSILNVYYVTPKEAKSIYKSKNLTLTKILRK